MQSDGEILGCNGIHLNSSCPATRLKEGLRRTPPRFLVTEVLVEQLAQRVPLAPVAAPHVDLRDHLGRLHFDELWEAVGTGSPRRRVHGPGYLSVLSRGITSNGGERDLPDGGRSLPYPLRWPRVPVLSESMG